MIMLNKKPHHFIEHICADLDRQWIVGLIIQKRVSPDKFIWQWRWTLKKIYFRLVGLKGQRRLFWCLFFLLEPVWKFPVRIICWEWFPVSTIKDVLVRKPKLVYCKMSPHLHESTGCRHAGFTMTLFHVYERWQIFSSYMLQYQSIVIFR